MKQRQRRLTRVVAIATALTLTPLIAAPTAEAGRFAGVFSTKTDSCAAGTNVVTEVMTDTYMFNAFDLRDYDPDTGITRFDPSEAIPTVDLYPGLIYWDEREPTELELHPGAGDVATRTLDAVTTSQISYLVNRFGKNATPRQALAVNAAIGVLAGDPGNVAYWRKTTCDFTNAVDDLVADARRITTPMQGNAQVAFQWGEHDLETHATALESIAVVDAGGFNYAEADIAALGVSARVKLSLTITDPTAASWAPQSGQQTIAVEVENGQIVNPPTLYARGPGDIAVTAYVGDFPAPTAFLTSSENKPNAKIRDQLFPRSTYVSTATNLTIPAEDMGLTIADVTSTSARLTWTQLAPWMVHLTRGYVLTVKNNTTGINLVSAESTFTNDKPLAGLRPNTAYTVTLASSDGLAPTQIKTFTTGPTAPTGVRATATSTGVGVSWEPSPGATSYRVAVGDHERTVTTTSATIGGLTPTTTYPVSVWAIGANPSTPSTTSVRTSLPTPTGLKTTASTSTSATLAWNPVAGATDYLVQLDGTTRTWSTSTPTVTMTGLAAGRTYTATITATAPGEALSQTTTSFTTIPNTPPVVSITKRTPTALTLTWTRGPADARYEVRVTGKGGKTVTTTSTSATITGLTAASAYAVSVRTIIGTATSAWQTPVTTSTAAKRKPKVKIKKVKKVKKVTVKKAAPGTKIRMQVRVGKKWRTVKILKTTRAGSARIKVKTRAKIRVVVAASPSTSKLVRIK